MVKNTFSVEEVFNWLKKIWFNNFLGPKKFFWTKHFFGPKKYFLAKNVFGRKNLFVENKYWVENSLGSKICWVDKIFMGYASNIFALVISYSSHETKTTKLQPKIEHIYRIFLPWSGVKMKNYKTTSRNRKCKMNIFTLVISNSSHETKTTKLQPKIEHLYRIFLPRSGVKMKNYKTTS